MRKNSYVKYTIEKDELHRSDEELQWWFTRDPCGLICVAITYLLILFGDFVVLFVVLWTSRYSLYAFINAVLFNWLVAMAIIAHARTMLTNPGAVPKGTATDEVIERLYRDKRDDEMIVKCPKCKSIKPDRAHHCSVCNRCIRRMDHHCPWVNNCIGENNQRFFVLFTMYIAILSAYALFLSLTHMINCFNGNRWTECSAFSPGSTTILLLALVFESLLFVLFTLIMCGTQIQAIISDETGIEQLKREIPRWRRRSRCSALRSVFGGRFSLRWFSPFVTPFHLRKFGFYSV